MYANHRHLILFVLAIVTFLTTTLGFVYLRSKIYATATSAAEIAKANEGMEEQKKHEVEVKRAYDKFTAENRAPANYIVHEEKIVDFIEAMELIGKDSGTTLEISGIETEKITKTAKIEHNFTHMKAHLNIAGTWENSMRAFALLEHAPYSMTFDDIQLYVDSSFQSAPTTGTTTPRDSIKKNTWRLSVNIKALVAP